MDCIIRKWQKEDAPELARAINNKNVQNNLRDGLPFPYTQADANQYIDEMLRADPNATFSFAITADGKVVGSIGAFRQGNDRGVYLPHADERYLGRRSYGFLPQYAR